MKRLIVSAIQQAVKSYPEVTPLLNNQARYIAALRPPAEIKTEDAYYRQIWNRTLELYRGEIDAGDFVGAMAEIIQEQLTKAFREALRDNELDPDLVNEDGEGFKDELEDMILNEFDFVDGFAADIQQAAKDDAGFEQFQTRAGMWANRYNDAYNQAQVIIGEQYGINLEWVYGEAEHCETCLSLNGIVARASVWDELGVKPQQPPNDILECGGWNCKCSLQPTDKRQSPKAYETIMNIVTK